MQYRKATPEDDDVLVRHYLAIWESYGTPADHFRADAEAVIGQFLEEGRRDRALASFIAFDGGIAAGSASCQLHQMPYPAALKSEHLLQGYVWSLFIDPAYRRQGVSKKLMFMILDHLRDIGCTGIVLHSSEAGEALYRSLGFEIAREMRLKF
ncbi:ribosomal protein S18 acetylase RimI-like enzyme [Rhizobium tibeticum]|uniref:GNAT family N-acetyltransferase n=1 Tax=Rhizobium tibeticum TaxID=501024 RepID=UPI00277D4F64|nr:GNAT family N-acetyltransferase [Rhizobium tibeticum]MDP9812198.1 ribosomal protein S18 acetylase RimI-like enzyme [Rhizobium tibeticum]